MTTPVALFAYRRPEHLGRVLDSLRSNPEAAGTELFVYSDAARKSEDIPLVEAVRERVRDLQGFRTVQLIERKENLGLSRSIITGVTELVERYGRVIVLEDDLVVSPDFLAYMNRGLELYGDDLEVASIHGYCYPVREDLPETFFIRGTDCWGWATWARAWKHFQPDGRLLLEQLKRRGVCREFDFGGSFPYVRMLKEQILGKNDSWAIRWYASAFLDGMLTLYPGKSLVANIGFDGSGEHCAEEGGMEGDLYSMVREYAKVPVRESAAARMQFERHFRTLRGSFAQRLLRKLKNRIRKAWRRG